VPGPNVKGKKGCGSILTRLAEAKAGGGKAFFFGKKKQKTFELLAAVFPVRLSPDLQKFFGSFFQKRTASLSLALHGTPGPSSGRFSSGTRASCDNRSGYSWPA
jgi:hypothetical protein